MCFSAGALHLRIEELSRSENFHRVQNRFGFWNLVGAEQIGFTKRGEHGEEWFGGADFLTKILEGVREGVANWEPEGAEAEGVQENSHLVPHANGAVLEIAVVEAEPRIEEDLFDAIARCCFNLAREIIMHHRDGVIAEVEVSDFADISALNVADDHGGVVSGGNAEEFMVIFGRGEVEDLRASFETGASDGGLIGFDGNENAGIAENSDDGKQLAFLSSVIDTSGVPEGGFRADVNDVRALLIQNFAAADGAFGRQTNAFAVPGVGGEVNDSHDCWFGIKSEMARADGEFADLRPGRGAVLFQQFSQIFKVQHRVERIRNMA